MNDEAQGSEEERREIVRGRWFFAVFFLAIFLSVSATFYRAFVARSYLIEVETKCDTETEACFSRNICDTSDQTCAESDTPTSVSYYKIVKKRASAFPAVCASGSLDAPECTDLSCRAGESDCAETLCIEGSAPDGETCVGPGVAPESPESSAAKSEAGGSQNNGAEATGGSD